MSPLYSTPLAVIVSAIVIIIINIITDLYIHRYQHTLNG